MTPLVTVACVLVRGNVPFTVDYVKRLRAMVSRQLSRKHRFVCLTDQPRRVSPHVDDVIEIRTPRNMFGWWAKLELFNPENKLSGRVVYLDLDVLLVDKLGPVVDFPAPFALVPHAGDFQGKDGKRVIKRYNSSVMAFEAEATHDIFEDWLPEHADELWGDQDWIGWIRPNEAMMPIRWFPRISELQRQWPNIGNDARVVLCKKPKNHEAVRYLDGFNEMWGG